MREAYARAQVLWELSEVPARTLADEDASALQGYLNAMNRSRRSSVRRWSGALAMAACLLLMISLGSGWQPSRWVDDLGADYVSAPGEIRTVTLADQSQVTLDADSAIAVDFSGGERHVQVRRGAGFFRVTHTWRTVCGRCRERARRGCWARSSKYACNPMARRSPCCPGGWG